MLCRLSAATTKAAFTLPGLFSTLQGLTCRTHHLSASRQGQLLARSINMSWTVGSAAGAHQLGGVASRGGRAVSLSAIRTPQAVVSPVGSLRDRAPLVSRMRASGITHVASQTPATTSGSAPSTSAATEASQPSSSTQKPGGQLLLSGGAFVLPHPEKMAKGGEDWYFISPSKRAIGVADGVGGWAEVGVDAGAYARQLMGNAREATDRIVGTSSSEQAGPTLSAQDILESAYTQTQVKGSSTACVIVVNGSTLIASNLGDSGFMVMRDGAMLMSTSQQQHSFNFPFQIGAADDVGDHPRAADRYEVQLMPGDIIVAGTDGLWDNCFHEEVVSVLKYCEKGKFPPAKAAQVLAHYARHRASDSKFASPFAYSAYQEGIKYLGGKMDDITVVLAFVERPGQQQQQGQGSAKAMAKL